MHMDAAAAPVKRFDMDSGLQSSSSHVLCINAKSIANNPIGVCSFSSAPYTRRLRKLVVSWSLYADMYEPAGQWVQLEAPATRAAPCLLRFHIFLMFERSPTGGGRAEVTVQTTAKPQERWGSLLISHAR